MLRVLGKTVRLGMVNILLFGALFAALELAYRAHVDGVAPTLRALMPASPSLNESNWVILDQELGYRLNPESEGINSRSVRGEEIAVPKPRGRYRIIYLGDSVTFDEPGFVSITRDSLSASYDAEVINAGVPGYTSYQEVLFFEKYLLQTDPDLVLWAYCLNDNHRFLHEFDRDGRMLVTREAQVRLRLDPPWNAIVSRSYVLTRLHRGIVTQLARPSDTAFEWEDRADFSIAWKDESWIEHKRNFAKLVQLMERRGTQLAVLIFPYEPQLIYADTLQGDPGRLAYVVKPQRKLREVADEFGIPYLDLMPIYLTEYREGRRFYRDGIHLNGEGHSFTAVEILRFLSEADLLPSADSDN